MADGVFNIAVGRGVEFYTRVDGNDPANSAFIIVLLKVVEVDDTLNNYADLAALFLGANTECNFTNYTRKIITDAELAAISAPDDTNNRRDLDIPDPVNTSAGGATNNNVVKLLVCYDSDTTGGGDANIIPLTYHDFVVTTDGSTITGNVNSAGFFRANGV